MRRSIVSTNVDGLGEVLRDGKNAVVVLPKATDKLASAIAALLADPETAQQLAAQAQRDSSEYDIQKTVSRLEDIYLGVSNH